MNNNFTKAGSKIIVTMKMLGLILVVIFVLILLIAIYCSGQSNTTSIITSDQIIVIDNDSINPINLNRYHLLNLSAHKTLNGFVGLIRVHDHQNEIGNSSTYSYPYYVHLTDDGHVIEFKRIDLNYSELQYCRSPYLNVHTNGIEDPRLFLFQGEEWCIANCLGSSEQTHPCVNTMCMFKLADPKLTFRLLKPPEGVNLNQRQKNWSPFEWNNRLMCEYSLKPRMIIQIDPETGTSNEIHRDNDDRISIQHPESLRGGAPPILINLEDKLVYLGIGHTIRGHDYLHFFYTFDPNPPFKYLNISSLFKLDGREAIQFATGLSYHNNRIYVSYGVNDNGNRISGFEIHSVIDLLTRLDSIDDIRTRLGKHVPVIASLTTIPPRMHNGEFKKCLDSLLKQSAAFDSIFVTIPTTYPRFPDYDGKIPDWLQTEPYCSRVIIIRPEEDSGSVSKYTGIAQYLSSLSITDPLHDAIIFICDDDQEYHPELCCRMLTTICKDRLLRSSSSFVIQNRYETVRFGSGGIIHGFVGLMVHASALKNLLSFDRPSVCRYVDDQYMSIYFAKHEIPIFPSRVETYPDIYSVMTNLREKNSATPESLAAYGSRTRYIQELGQYFDCQFEHGGQIKFN
jgi:predicted GH43/DUF377 family glycosyl hydrolase